MVNKGWIGVDLDGTLAHYDSWQGWNVFGEPIAPMIERVRSWLQEGRDVRIFTARIGNAKSAVEFHEKCHSCRVTGQRFSDHDMYYAIRAWCLQHVGQPLPVTCVKDVHMIELWDDRCVQVVPNTGRTVAEEAEARYNAERGKVFQGDDETHPDDGKYSDFRGGDE